MRMHLWCKWFWTEYARKNKSEIVLTLKLLKNLSNSNESNHITGKWKQETISYTTICYEAVYNYGDINMQFLANDKAELKKWNNIFISREYCKHLENGQNLNLTDQKQN